MLSSMQWKATWNRLAVTKCQSMARPSARLKFQERERPFLAPYRVEARGTSKIGALTMFDRKVAFEAE